ncbi:hypothetical protein KKG72_10840 [bacterium]|nr:hypothetical protein [bacterium]MBU1993511.1 hypothetical protein [bacterium]
MRPSVVEDKSRVGDWEADTIIGKNHHQASVTLVDRNSKFTLMKKVEAKQARVVTDAIIHLLKPKHLQSLATTAQRVLNEYTNGLIREYFPKMTEFKNITDEQIVDVQNNRLKTRPRKTLGYKTPAEVFFDTITKSYAAV